MKHMEIWTNKVKEFEAMAEANTKATLLRKLETERERWETLLAGFEEAQLVAPMLPDQRSIKDVIAHLTAWQRQTVDRLEGALKDETPHPPEWPQDLDEDDDVDQINEWIFQTYRPLPLAEVLQEWRQGFQQVLDLGAVLSEAALTNPGRYPWLEGAPLSEVLAGVYEHHHDEHLLPLQEWLAKNKASTGIQTDRSNQG